MGQTQPTAATNGGSSRRRRAWGGVAGFILLLFLTVFGGYAAGIKQRQDAYNSQLNQALGEQFTLGVQDFEAGSYDLARQRFEYIISQDPSYPGAAEKLAEVLFQMSVTPTPEATLTPTITPTPDLSAATELYDRVRELLVARKWTEALDALAQLRKSEPGFRTVAVDGMYYIALRNSGIDKILLEGNLEGGMYDLALAEKFGPLDGQADGLRTWSRLYITGASFWDLDWTQVLFYFGQIYPYVPNLRDSSGLTATERYRLALVKYGDQLALAGEWCQAKEQYDAALLMAPNPTVEPTATEVANLCEPPPPPVVDTPTPTPGTPTVTPTPTETPSP